MGSALLMLSRSWPRVDHSFSARERRQFLSLHRTGGSNPYRGSAAGSHWYSDTDRLVGEDAEAQLRPVAVNLAGVERFDKRENLPADHLPRHQDREPGRIGYDE